MPTAVVGSAVLTARSQIEHLVLKGIRAQRPAMAEDNGLTRAPILELDLRTVLGSNWIHIRNSNPIHSYLSLRRPAEI